MTKCWGTDTAVIMRVLCYVISEETFTMRQKQAADLKVKIDRADRLDDSQLADLRAEIKVSHKV